MPTMFLQHLWLGVLPSYDSVENLPNGFLFQCSLFFESLVEPKTLDKKWMSDIEYSHALSFKNKVVTMPSPIPRPSPSQNPSPS